MSTLHITNGDSAADKLRTFLPDPVVITADPLHDGPAPNVDDESWYLIRGRQLSDGETAAHRVAAELASWDRAVLDALARGDEIVLWFEHDLFDQLLLIRTLDRIHRAQRAGRTSLICIDRFPGVHRFIGLGQLSPTQLSSLISLKQPVTDAQFDQAARVWAAFRASDPTLLSTMTGPGPLPFLGAAIRRLCEEYPSTFNGLSRSATQVLRALDRAPLEGGALFMASQSMESTPFMGDWGLFDVVRSLARGRVPLATIEPESRAVDLRGHTVSMTDAGREVLAGRQDWVVLNGIDEWRGGVHLTGERTTPWRWDAARETLVSLDT